ncbi:MAG: ribonuclease E/G [Candidatus Puniceispirillaceae bacterium]
MTKKLLIDAHQPEETRVALLNNNRIEEFDYENSFQRQLKGNVYLARVTRVEPSLQAAFVEYGGNRQGFLAFSEIHPDYYRIPVEDREQIEAEEADVQDSADQENQEAASSDEGDTSDSSSSSGPETLGGEDEVDQPRRSHRAFSRRYKIQEVIARKQILLIQVVKEERGNKGAALTTYLSLAGRYCVLMPNANRGGGVSRKIVNSADRKRLKVIIEDLEVPQGMAIIARTAGAKRTKTEIKRDYAYLAKLWDDIRTKTLESEAPSLIHEEGALVKKAVRDIYTNDIDEVIVEGEEAYKQAKAQMKMLIPSHAKKVVKYEEQPHLFQAYAIEEQLDSVYDSEVTLKSGGYLVINQTEALVAVDVNSGKATKERNIEETALKTNLEAAEEVGRQLKLRDLSGLIVIDFIDMEENRNQNAVERRLKDAVRHDRARIQVGSISHFGLLEMSRQRLRPSLVETVSQTCPHCEGTGRVRSVHSSALHMLRVIEKEAASHKDKVLEITINSEIAIYILNHKRASLAEIEALYKLTIIIEADRHISATDYNLAQSSQPSKGQKQSQKQKQQASQPSNGDSASDYAPDGDGEDDKDENNKKRRRGRRGGRRRKKRGQESESGEVANQTDVVSDTPESATDEAPQDGETTEEGASKSRRRRGRGRGRGRKQSAEAVVSEEAQDAPSAEAGTESPAEGLQEPQAEGVKEKAPQRKGRGKSKAAKSSEDAQTAPKEKVAITDTDEADGSSATAKKAAKKKAAKKKAAKKKVAKKKAEAKAKSNDKSASEQPQASESHEKESRAPISSVPADVVEVGSDSAPKAAKKGWWSR